MERELEYERIFDNDSEEYTKAVLFWTDPEIRCMAEIFNVKIYTPYFDGWKKEDDKTAIYINAYRVNDDHLLEWLEDWDFEDITY